MRVPSSPTTGMWGKGSTGAITLHVDLVLWWGKPYCVGIFGDLLEQIPDEDPPEGLQVVDGIVEECMLHAWQCMPTRFKEEISIGDLDCHSVQCALWSWMKIVASWNLCKETLPTVRTSCTSWSSPITFAHPKMDPGRVFVPQLTFCNAINCLINGLDRCCIIIKGCPDLPEYYRLCILYYWAEGPCWGTGRGQPEFVFLKISWT